jgi:hypothetical protein
MLSRDDSDKLELNIAKAKDNNNGITNSQINNKSMIVKRIEQKSTEQTSKVFRSHSEKSFDGVDWPGVD